MKSFKAENAQKIKRLEDYILNLTFTGQERFPSAHEIYDRVGRILGLWE